MPDGEKRAIDHDDAGEPIGEIGGEVAHGWLIRAEPGDGLPAVDAGMNAAIEGDELLLRLGFGDEGADEPEDGGDESGEQSGLCGDDGAVAYKFHVGKDEGNCGGPDGGDDFTPGIDAPPVPTKNKDGSGAGTDTQHDLPTF